MCLLFRNMLHRSVLGVQMYLKASRTRFAALLYDLALLLKKWVLNKRWLNGGIIGQFQQLKLIPLILSESMFVFRSTKSSKLFNEVYCFRIRDQRQSEDVEFLCPVPDGRQRKLPAQVSSQLVFVLNELVLNYYWSLRGPARFHENLLIRLTPLLEMI